MAVTNQPARFLPSEFQTGVCDCCEDLSVCESCTQTSTKFKYGAWSIQEERGSAVEQKSPKASRVFLLSSGCLGCFCYMCLGCTIASDMGECCMFGTGYPIRSVYRTRYNIQVSVRPQRRRVSCSYRFNSKTGSSLWDHVIHVLQTSDHLIIFSDSKLALNY